MTLTQDAVEYHSGVPSGTTEAAPQQGDAR